MLDIFQPLLFEYSLQIGPFSTDSSVSSFRDCWGFPFMGVPCLFKPRPPHPLDERSCLFPGFSTTVHATVNVLPCWAHAYTYKLSNEQPNLVACCVEPSPKTKQTELINHHCGSSKFILQLSSETDNYYRIIIGWERIARPQRTQS